MKHTLNSRSDSYSTYGQSDFRLCRGLIPVVCVFILMLFGVVPTSAHVASADSVSFADSIRVGLGEVEALGRQHAERHLSNGGLYFDTSALATQSRQLGEVDIINLLKRHSGISSAGDYGSGLMVDGNDASQSLYTLAGVPVLFPYRLGGIFSTFHTSHFSGATFERNIHGASMPGRLGAHVDFEPWRHADRLAGEVNVGMLASSLSLKAPLSERFNIVVSGRISYVNELYSWLLNMDDARLRYDFRDFNLTANYRVGRHDVISLDGFTNYDKLSYEDDDYDMDTHMGWRNGLASLSWTHNDSACLRSTQRVYGTVFHNKLRMSIPNVYVGLKSEVNTVGVSGDLEMSSDSGDVYGGFDAGYELMCHYMTPQSREVSGIGSSRKDGMEDYSPFEGRVYGDVMFNPLKRLSLKAGVSASLFCNGSYHAATLEPRITATLANGHNRWAMHGGLEHQNFHNVGFSELGLSSNFWLPATEHIPKQRCVSTAAEYTRFFTVAGLRVNAAVYYKRVLSQPEYHGMLIDLMDNDFTISSHVVESNGFNTGMNLGAEIDVDNFIGEVAYGYGCARRKYPGENRYLRGLSDTGHTLHINGSYRSGHWTFGVNFKYASGRPCTPVEAIYTIANNLIQVYGERNSARFPSYHRLDLSVTYSFTSRLCGMELRSHVNASLLNAYGHDNVEMQSFTIDAETGTYRFKQVSSLYRFMPSLSYTIDF